MSEPRTYSAQDSARRLLQWLDHVESEQIVIGVHGDIRRVCEAVIASGSPVDDEQPGMVRCKGYRRCTQWRMRGGRWFCPHFVDPERNVDNCPNFTAKKQLEEQKCIDCGYWRDVDDGMCVGPGFTSPLPMGSNMGACRHFVGTRAPGNAGGIVACLKQIAVASVCSIDEVQRKAWREARADTKNIVRCALAEAGFEGHGPFPAVIGRAIVEAKHKAYARATDDATMALDKYRAELKHQGRHQEADVVEACRDRVRAEEGKHGEIVDAERGEAHMSNKPQVHPIQAMTRDRKLATAPTCVTMRAYEVYCHVFGPQEALITGSCRGGFGADELIAFLYARSFPREEWNERFSEATNGLHIC